MLFNSINYLVFFLLVWLAYRSLGLRQQNHLLLVASYVFYGSWDWRFLSLILISTVVDFYCGAAMHRADDPAVRKRLLLLSLTVNLGLLGLFKYFGFFVDSFVAFAAVFGWHVDTITMRLILPVGISFYTFQTLSYTIDIYRRQLEPEPRFLNFALFVAFFPQLVAGPIERARRLLPQIRTPRRLTTDDLAAGLW
ncbi:MAG TPA: MBOAT family protein, partial [Gammaproteobacteria bacterium]|nr:MBOAT family protein [Gammaproteobacteria bacterium]